MTMMMMISERSGWQLAKNVADSGTERDSKTNVHCSITLSSPCSIDLTYDNFNNRKKHIEKTLQKSPPMIKYVNVSMLTKMR